MYKSETMLCLHGFHDHELEGSSGGHCCPGVTIWRLRGQGQQGWVPLWCLLSLGALGFHKVEVCARDQTMILSSADLESGVTEGRVTTATTGSGSLRWCR